MKKNLYKELFDMVYQWGRVGVVTDENCKSFQSLIRKIERKQIKPVAQNTARYILDLIKSPQDSPNVNWAPEGFMSFLDWLKETIKNKFKL